MTKKVKHSLPVEQQVTADQLRAMHRQAVENVNANVQPFLPQASEKQAFVDATAIALYAKGFPEKNVFTQAERLWTLRCAHIAAKAPKTNEESSAPKADE